MLACVRAPGEKVRYNDGSFQGRARGERSSGGRRIGEGCVLVDKPRIHFALRRSKLLLGLGVLVVQFAGYSGRGRTGNLDSAHYVVGYRYGDVCGMCVELALGDGVGGQARSNRAAGMRRDGACRNLPVRTPLVLRFACGDGRRRVCHGIRLHAYRIGLGCNLS